MSRLPLLAGFLAGLAVAWVSSCGGGGVAIEATNVASIVPNPPHLLAFDEQWEQRTPETGVYGVVSYSPLIETPDHSDPQQGWSANAITGRWGTLRTLDGSVAGLPDVTGLGPNPSWSVNGRLSFHAESATAPTGQTTGGFALISRQTFSRAGRITVETTIDLTQGGIGAFAGIALIAGEGDYRELAIYRRETGDTIDRVAPLDGVALGIRPAGPVTLRIEYSLTGFDYFANGKLIGHEDLSHLGASFSADPGVGLYFTSPTFAEGQVGPVRVWTSNV